VNKNYPIYIVEDDVPVNTLILKFLEKQGFTQVSSYYSSEEMIKELKPQREVIIIQDYDLPGKNGLETICEIKPAYPKTDFIFLSGQRSIDIAIEAIKNGAFDYIVKDNFAKENVATKINNLLRIKSLESDRKRFKKSLIIFLALLFISWIILFIEFIMN
jgi:FixJ family two-component response regulator